MSKQPARKETVMVRLSKDELKVVNDLTEYFRRGMPGTNFSVSDVIRFAIDNLVRAVHEDEFVKGIQDRLKLGPKIGGSA